MNERIKRIEDKLLELESYLVEAYQIIPESWEEYIADIKTKAACERYFEKIIGVIIDIGFLIMKFKEYELPDSEEGIFVFLANKEIISQELAKRLKDAKGMRNILAHEYGIVDDSLVFNSIKEELDKDAQDFIESINNAISQDQTKKQKPSQG